MIRTDYGSLPTFHIQELILPLLLSPPLLFLRNKHLKTGKLLTVIQSHGSLVYYLQNNDHKTMIFSTK